MVGGSITVLTRRFGALSCPALEQVGGGVFAPCGVLVLGISDSSAAIEPHRVWNFG